MRAQTPTVRNSLTRRPPTRNSLADLVRRRIVGHVRDVFNDRGRGEAPVQRSATALFRPDSVIWRVHGDVTTMMVGGVASLLLQMLHPRVLAGVWDHSNFRRDMLGRLRRTAKFIAVTTYGDAGEADAIIARIRRIHDHVAGTLPDGTPYSANDPELLAWVHVTEASSFLDAWIRYGEPAMSMRDQDCYFAEMAVVGERVGAHPLPRTRAEARALIETMRPQLRFDARTREITQVLMDAPPPSPSLGAEQVQRLTFQAAVDLLPDWARAMHRLPNPRIAVPLVRTGIMGMAQTLRWAFA